MKGENTFFCCLTLVIGNAVVLQMCDTNISNITTSNLSRKPSVCLSLSVLRLVLLELCDSVSRCHPSFLFWSPSFWLLNFPLFVLSPPVLPPPLPASHSSSAPSQTAVSQLCLVTAKAGLACKCVCTCLCLCYCALCWACTSYNVHVCSSACIYLPFGCGGD